MRLLLRLYCYEVTTSLVMNLDYINGLLISVETWRRYEPRNNEVFNNEVIIRLVPFACACILVYVLYMYVYYEGIKSDCQSVQRYGWGGLKRNKR